jgi:hypothetical protein
MINDCREAMEKGVWGVKEATLCGSFREKNESGQALTITIIITH